MTSQHNTGTHPFYIGMYIHICTHIYVHIYTSQKECLCIFCVSFKYVSVRVGGHTIQMRQQLYSCQHLYCCSCGFPLFCFALPQEALGFLCFVLPAGRSTVLPSTRPYNEIHSQMSKQAHTEMQQIVTVHGGEPSCR